MSDLTRWNRAGLSRIEYLDGNAAVYLERLRAGLAGAFPGWTSPQATFPANESEEARKARLEALYAADPDDILWQLTRQFARACHVFGGHLDAYANEAYLGTASQWDNLRRLVALLDYAPRPPASASAPLAVFLKEGKAGTVTAGLQIKHSPASGAPLVFETLTDLEADAAFNTLYALDHRRNPQTLTGGTLVLEGRLDKLKSNEPLVLEDERTGQLSAHLIEGVSLGESTTTVTVRPPIPHGFANGWTLVHLLPKEKLTPLGPATSGASHVGCSLQLAVPATGLTAGDIVLIRSGNDKPYYRRIKAVHADRLVFYHKIDQLTLAGATVARPVTVPLSDLANPPVKRRIAGKNDPDKLAAGTVIDVVYAAGDWSRLAGEWLTHIQVVREDNTPTEYLPLYHCFHAKYVPVTKDNAKLGADERPGYTALTLAWHKSTDGVKGKDATALQLNNPQTLLAPPPTAGPWLVDTFLNKSDGGRILQDLVTSLGKQTAAGDLAVVVKGQQMAWARLGTVAQDLEREEATLTASPAWQDRGGGPYFLSVTRVFSHFSQSGRVSGWTENTTPLTGCRLVAETVPSGLKTGRAMIVDNGTTTQETTLVALDTAGTWLELADLLPAGTTAGNLKLYANVVTAGHGETRPQRVLGSGDATLSNQRFTLEAAGSAFVADAAMTTGVRAALEVTVTGETWTQVATLKDSAPSDAHYQVRLDQDGNVEIQFGDGRHGRRLPSGANNVRVSFRQGAGAAGNLDPGCLIKPARPHQLIDSIAQPLATSGGADRESNDDLRENAPATLLALDRAVSLEDYTQLARGHSSVWQARAFRLPPGLGQRERLEVVVMAAGGGTLSRPLKDDLRAYLLARAQPGVALNVSDYVPLTFRVQVTVRVRTEAYDSETVVNDLRAALEAAFSAKVRQLGQPLYRGEIYQVVDGVTGVENSECAIQLDAPPAGASPAKTALTGEQIMVARPDDNCCLVLNSTASAITPLPYTL